MPLKQQNFPAGETGQRVRVLWGLLAVLTALAGWQVWVLVNFQPLGIDFLPLWTAGRMAWSKPGDVYDFAAVTHAQGWLLPHFPWMRPYAYPPSALLILAPLGRLPFWAALAIWLAASLAAFLHAGGRLARERRGLAMLLIAASPAVVLATFAGQAVLLVAGLMVTAFIELERRPRFAGALLALALAIKPQAGFMAPVALLAAGAFEAMASAAIVGTVLIAVSAALFGPARWSGWIASLPAFEAVIEGVPRFALGLISPSGLARELGLSGLAAFGWRAASSLVGAALVWRAFARPGDLARRLGMLMVGAILATPYALSYDGALLVPAAAALAVGEAEEPGWGLRLAAFCAVCAVTAPGVGFLAVCAFAVLISLGPAPRQVGAPTLAV